MEVLLLTTFFITVLVLFIAGKDDFGRTENKLIIKESGEIKKEVNIESTVEVKRAKGKVPEKRAKGKVPEKRAKGKVPVKRAKEFASGVESGVKTAVKFAKDVKKVVSEEAQEDLEI